MEIKTVSRGADAAQVSTNIPKKGEIYFVENAKHYMEAEGGKRPAIIVSEEHVNHSNRVTVVFLTLQDRHREDHVPVNVLGTDSSYAICDNLMTIYKDRLGRYIKTATEAEMQAIDREIKRCLGLQEPERKKSPDEALMCIGCQEKKGYDYMKQKAREAEQELEIVKRMYNELLERVMARV